MKYLVTLILVCGAITAHGQDTTLAIPKDVMLKIIQDVERGKLCREEVKALEFSLEVCEKERIYFKAIFSEYDGILQDSESMYQEEKKGRENAEKAGKKYKLQRDVVGGVSLVIIILLIL